MINFFFEEIVYDIVVTHDKLATDYDDYSFLEDGRAL